MYLKYVSNFVLHLFSLNQVLHAPPKYSTQTKQYITFSSHILFYTVTVSLKKCEFFVTFEYRLKTYTFSNIIVVDCNTLQHYYCFFSIAFHIRFMSESDLSTSYNQINRLVLSLRGISLTINISFPSS